MVVIDTADVVARANDYKEYLSARGLSWRKFAEKLLGLTEDKLSAVLSANQNRPWEQLTPKVKLIYARMDCWMNTRHLGLLIKLIKRLPCTILNPKLINCNTFKTAPNHCTDQKTHCQLRKFLFFHVHFLTINQVGAVQLGAIKRRQSVEFPARARSKSRKKMKQY